MKPAPLLVFLPLLLPVYALAASPITKPALREDGVYRITDNGGRMNFRIAKDELMETSDGRSKRINVSSKEKLRQMRETAKQLGGPGRKVDFIAYPEGKPAIDQFRRTITNQVSVDLADGVDPNVVARAVNAKGMQDFPYLPGTYVMEFEDSAEALVTAEALTGIPGVIRSNVMLGRKPEVSLVPNDPLFSAGNQTYPNFIGPDRAEFTLTQALPQWVTQPNTRGYQWYLSTAPNPQVPSVLWANVAVNDLGPLYDPVNFPTPLPFFIRGGLPDPEDGKLAFPKYFEWQTHINVEDAWDQVDRQGRPIDGEGVKVGIVDTGVQLNHTDFVAAKNLIADDYNFIDGDQSDSSIDPRRNDPTPPPSTGTENHGTNVAGVIRAARNNNRGISGIAPGASMAAYRAVGSFIDDAKGADAMVFGSRLIRQRDAQGNFVPLTGKERRTGLPKFDISVNAYNWTSGGIDLYTTDKFRSAALKYGVETGRVSATSGVPLGVVYIVPAGNDAWLQSNTNYSTWTNSPYAITVGSVSDLGRRIETSNTGASLHVVAPSSGGEMPPRINKSGLFPTTYPLPRPATLQERAIGNSLRTEEYLPANTILRNTQRITTTNLATSTTAAAGYYTNFGGTSAAAAMAGGVAALVLQANPNLGYRDVMEILMRSAQVVDAGMGEWSINALGMPMSHKYGAGVIDADRAVRMAKVWQNNGLLTEMRNVISANRLIFDNGQLVSMPVTPPPTNFRVEQVQVKLQIRHFRRGDLGIALESPKNGQADFPVESFLYVPHRRDTTANIGNPSMPRIPDDPNADPDLESYTFNTVRHWGTSVAQNQSLSPDSPPDASNWQLHVWDHTKKGTSVGNVNAADLDERFPVAVANPPLSIYTAQEMQDYPTRVLKAEVTYLGTTTPSRNLAPIIENNAIIGQINAPFRGFVLATTDLTPDPIDFTPRAPITSYRIRVVRKLSDSSPDLIIGPSTLPEYQLLYQPGPSPAHLRFDRATGLLTNENYPGTGPGTTFFKPLPSGSWELEVYATNVFGTTRKVIPFTTKARLTYSEWRLIEFTPDQIANVRISGEDADPDGDGIPNMMEYGMGGKPFVNEPALTPFIRRDGDNLVVDYQYNTSTLALVVSAQVSNNLVDWTNLPFTETASDTTLPFRILSFRRATTPYTPGINQFLRVRVAPAGQ